MGGWLIAGNFTSPFFGLLKKINLLIILFLAVLRLRCCTWAFSSCNEWGLLFVVVLGLLAHGLQ